jgi:hypothetical protein
MLKYTSIPLTGGMNRNTSPFLIADGEMLEIQNFTTHKIGVLKKSGDYEIKNSQIISSQDILGGVDFALADGTHQHVVAINGASNAGLYKDVTGTWTDQSQSLTKGNKVRFSQSPALDLLFACNFADATRSFNGTSWSTSTSVTSAPKAKFTIRFGDRIWLLHCVLGGNTYVSRGYRSTTTETTPITWDSDDWWTFNDVITGVGKSGENMFVGCEKSCQIFTLADVRYEASSHGCVSHDGIASYGPWVFFPSKDGMYLYDGGNDTKISLAVQDFWDAIPNANLSEIKARVKGHHLYISIGDVTVEDRDLINVVLDYNILQENWTRFSLIDNVLDMHTFTESTGEEIFIGNDNGEMFEMFSSGTQNTGVFSSFIETPWIYGNGPKIIDDFREFWAHGELLSGLKIKYKVDNKGWESVGELKGFSDFIKLKVSGKRIKFLLEEVSKSNMYEVHALEVGFKKKFDEDKED